jgi:patatin-like phospholipase/acyl hydrolase
LTCINNARSARRRGPPLRRIKRRGAVVVKIVAMATSKSFRILALAGGGYLGLYTASVLAALEARCGEPLGRRFDLIAGTSVGGILAVALAYEVPMRRLVDLFVEHGP